MMWLLLAFLSAALLGFYDAFKKESLRDNAVLPVLFLNTLFSSLIFLPFILISAWSDSLDGTIFHVPAAGWEVHKYVLLKSVIVLSSWTFGYFGMKHLPLTIVGPINATRPVMVLVGALLVFGERLNLYQWAGVLMAVISFFMLSRSGKKEGIDFKHNRYIFYVVLAAVTGAISGLYDKYLMAPVSEGGLGLSTQEVGFVQGTVGVLGLTLGGIIGGIAASRNGLKKWLWPMVWSITLPDLVYVYLSYFQSTNFLLINAMVFIEQFGYGFGFTAYMLFLLYYSQGEQQTSHYAFCTAFMALSMMLPGAVAGELQEAVGYFHFFLIVMACCLVTVGVTALLKIDPEFGKKEHHGNQA